MISAKNFYMGLGNQMYLKRNSPITTFMIKNSDCPLLVKIKIKIQLVKYWLPSTRLDAHSWLSEGERDRHQGKCGTMWRYLGLPKLGWRTNVTGI